MIEHYLQPWLIAILSQQTAIFLYVEIFCRKVKWTLEMYNQSYSEETNNSDPGRISAFISDFHPSWRLVSDLKIKITNKREIVFFCSRIWISDSDSEFQMQSFLTRCKRNPHDVALFGLCQLGIVLVSKRIVNEINLISDNSSAGNLIG